MEKEGFPYDPNDPDVNGAEDICPKNDDPIGDIQSVLLGLSGMGNSSYDITEPVPEKK